MAPFHGMCHLNDKVACHNNSTSKNNPQPFDIDQSAEEYLVYEVCNKVAYIIFFTLATGANSSYFTSLLRNTKVSVN